MTSSSGRPGARGDALPIQVNNVMRTSLLASLMLLPLAAAPVAAQGVAVPPRPSLLTPHGGLMFWTLIVFVVLLFVLTRFAFGPITRAVEAREKALQDAIEAAQRDRAAASELLEQQRRQLDASRGEAQKLIAEGRRMGEQMRTELLEQTHVQQRELLDRARQEIESEKEKAIHQLRREAVDLALAAASKVVEKNLDDQTNRKLIDDYLHSLGPVKTAGAV